jgi:hypothetical protein
LGGDLLLCVSSEVLFFDHLSMRLGQPGDGREHRLPTIAWAIGTTLLGWVVDQRHRSWSSHRADRQIMGNLAHPTADGGRLSERGDLLPGSQKRLLGQSSSAWLPLPNRLAK